MPLEHNCVVHIKSRLSTNDAHTLSTGSGYLVTPKHIITAAHVVYHKENCSNPNTDLDTLKTKVKVKITFSVGQTKIYFAAPVWHDKQADICLLELSEDLTNPVTPNFKFGKLVRIGGHKIKYEACGFPKATEISLPDSSTSRLPAGFYGKVDLHGQGNIGLSSFPITVDPGSTVNSLDLYQGFSGSAIFVEDFLVGILSSVLPNYNARLMMSSISPFFQDPTFLNILGINDSSLSPVTSDAKLFTQTPVDQEISLTPCLHGWIGRKYELGTIKNLLTRDNYPQIIGIIGYPGIGKTFLAGKLEADFKEINYFVSTSWITFETMLNKDPEVEFHQIIDSLLLKLSSRKITLSAILEQNSHEKVQHLLKILASDRHLIIFDNVEKILETKNPSYAGYFNNQYKEFIWLIKQIGFINHKSKIILLSRETIAELETNTYFSFCLSGLDQRSSFNYLARFNLKSNKKDLKSLHAKYKGNPKALSLVASLIRDDPRYKSNVRLFLKDRKWLVITDINNLVKEIIERLSSAEYTILSRLSIYDTIEYPLYESAILCQSTHFQEYEVKETIITALIRRQLIDINIKNTSYEIHPFIKEKFFAILQQDQSDFEQSHLRAAKHFLSLSDLNNPTWNHLEDIKPLIMAVHHLYQISNLNQVAKIICHRSFRRILVQWSEFRLIVKLYSPLCEILLKGNYQILELSEHVCIVFNVLGIAYRKLKLCEKSLRIYTEGLNHAQNINNTYWQVIILDSLSHLYQDMYKYNQAVESAKKALTMLDSNDSEYLRTASYLYGSLGVSYLKLKEYNRAISNLNLSLDFCISDNNEHGKGYTYGNLGEVYYLLGDFKNSLNNLKKSIIAFQKANNRDGQSHFLKILSKVYFDKKNYEFSLACWLHSKNLILEIKEKEDFELLQEDTLFWSNYEQLFSEDQLKDLFKKIKKRLLFFIQRALIE